MNTDFDPDRNYDDGSCEHVRRELESINPDYLLRGRLLALRKKMADNALALLDLLSPLSPEPMAFPQIKANPRREELIRNAESSAASVAFWVETLAADVAPKEPK